MSNIEAVKVTAMDDNCLFHKNFQIFNNVPSLLKQSRPEDVVNLSSPT